jgi:hypothetical protein
VVSATTAISSTASAATSVAATPVSAATTTMSPTKVPWVGVPGARTVVFHRIVAGEALADEPSLKAAANLTWLGARHTFKCRGAGGGFLGVAEVSRPEVDVSVSRCDYGSSEVWELPADAPELED